MLQGGRGTLATLIQSFRNNHPVVVVRESGGCARALADWVLELQRAGHVALANRAEATAALTAHMEARCGGASRDALERDVVQVVEPHPNP